MFIWPGIDVQLNWQSKRTGRENNWYALTGRVVAVKVEADGDLHLALQDATGNKPGIVVCEVPAKPQWCEIRQRVFSWTRTRFPYWDIGHSPKDGSTGERDSRTTPFGKFTPQ
jgi:hypothetical protein